MFDQFDHRQSFNHDILRCRWIVAAKHLSDPKCDLSCWTQLANSDCQQIAWKRNRSSWSRVSIPHTRARTHPHWRRCVRFAGTRTYGRAGKFTDIHLFSYGCAGVRARASDGHDAFPSDIDVCCQLSNKYIDGKMKKKEW